MATLKTLTEVLQHRRSHQQSITHINGGQDERRVSFEDLYQRALGILHHLQREGLRTGDEVILLLSSNEQFVDAFWACMLGGFVPVPIAVGISDEHRRKVFKIFTKLTRPYLYTDAKTLQRLGSFAQADGRPADWARIQERSLVTDSIQDISSPGKVHDARPEDVAFIQFSSGSTAEPKGVVLTHKNILANIEAITEGAEVTERDVALSWMPLTHDMGLIGFHLTTLFNAVNHFLMPTDVFIRRPLLWLKKASEKRASLLCSPNFGYKHVLKVFKENKPHDIDLSRVRLIFNGAEPISFHLCEQFLEKMAPYGLKRGAMFPVYGLAEASLAVTFPAWDAEPEAAIVDRRSLKPGGDVQFLPPDSPNALRFMNLGHPLRSCEVRITDELNIPVSEHVIGHIQIRGDNVTSGYYQDDTTNRATIREEGWLDTGDLGFMVAGDLVVTGRAKDIIFANGQNYYPHDLESIAAHADQLDMGKVVVTAIRQADADADEVLVFLLFRGALKDFAELAHGVARLLNEQAGLGATHIIPVKRIPKTTSGKIQRHLLADAYLEGEYTQLLEQLAHLQNTSEPEDVTARTRIESTLKQICDNTLTEQSVGLHDNLFELGTSSLVLVQIHEGIEEAFPGVLEITDLFDYPTISDLAGLLEERTAQHASAV